MPLRNHFFPLFCLVLLTTELFTWDSLSRYAYAIDVDLTMEQAKQALSHGRESMEKAENVEDVANIMKAAERAIRVGDNPEEAPCGPHAILRTRRYWLEYFGRREAAESKRQKKTVRMPDSKIEEILKMPYLEVEVRLCGDEEFFAEGVDVALQQGRTMARPVDVGAAERGKKNPGDVPSYRSRFTARFAYADFDPTAESTLAVFFPDGNLININADLSKIH
ncbi:MAG: hypothetical protein MRJ96_03885 [Nitrospirales bacterium]|nr:hypothetical protein [Nitrospira sp.]MDR4500579.1 hypothetical protein [Nitrospirales bacterium]